jgi:PAS domain S-box-containing protein
MRATILGITTMSLPGTPPLPDQAVALAALLIPAIRDALVVTDAEGRVTYWNDGATRVFGWTAEEMVGRPLVERLPADVRDDVTAQIEAVLAGAEWHGECEDYRKDGSRVWLDASVRPVPGPDGTIVGVFGIAQDITARKHAEAAEVAERRATLDALRRSEARLNLAQRAARIGSWTWTPETGEVWWSDLIYELFGVDRSITPSFEAFLSILHPDDRPRAIARVESIRRGSDGYAEDFRMLRPDGRTLWIHSRASVIRDDTGAVTGVEGTDQDITERKRADQEMRESEERLRIVLEAAGAAAFTWDADTDRVVRYYSKEPALPANVGAPETVADVVARVHPDDRDLFQSGVAACLDGGGDEYRNLYRVLRADGSYRWLQEWGHLDRRADGTPTRLTGISIDVTERTSSENALVRHNRVLEMIAQGTALTTILSEVVTLVEEQLQHSLCSVLLVDAAGRLRLGAAPSLPAAYNEAIDGAPVGPLNGSCGAAAHFGETVVADDIETSEVWQTYKAAALAHGLRSCLSVPILASGHVAGVPRGKVLGTFAVYRRQPGPPDPQAFALLSGGVSAAPDPGASGGGQRVAGAAHLIRVALEHHLAEEGLRASEARFRDVLDASPAIVYLKDLSGRYQFVNQRLVEVIGIPAAQWIGRTARDLLPDALATDFERNDAIVRETLRPHQVEERGQLPNGRIVSYLSMQFPLFDRDGAAYAICGISTDITERLAALEERDYLWNNSPDPVCIAGFDGYLHQLNPAWTQRLGWTAEELQSRPWIEFVHPEDIPATLAAGERLLRGEVVYGFENRYRTSDGRYRWFSWNVMPIVEQRSMYGFIRDITEEKRLRDQIRQAQKMEAVGQLAGGVAHDFNNLLTVINGYTTLLLGQMSSEAPERDALLSVRDAGDRAAALTAQLLAFSRKAIVEPKVLDLNATADASIRLLRRLIGEDIRLEVALAPDLPKIRVDPGQLEQVVMNLVVNARDAMPTGGLLEVSTGVALVPTTQSTESADVPSGRYVRLTVSDSGAGMSAEVKSHLFEPFFTTKGVGKGTGLGLATVYGIVKQAGGTITVDSDVGRGTAFHVLFPAVEREPAAAPADGPQATPAGHETLLVVEDEDAVRRFTKLALEMQGYVVYEATSAATALALPHESLSTVALLLTDVVMPGTGGRQLADALRQRYPDMRVLYMSGYTDDAVVRHGLEAATDAFLQKPFTPDALARKVRDVLDAHLKP